ncbi:MAG TPA: HAMP domain-containing sensor histidine kinase [Methylocella sp.]|nr:HAMP domain-containing sensor histidine kinase [Methylocella sp.]
MAIGKLFRTTAFKISLAYLILSAIGASIVLGTVGWNMKHLVEEEIAQTIDADIKGLSEQYAQGGINLLARRVLRRTRRPGAKLYLVTTPAGEPIAGNVTSLPSEIHDEQGYFKTTYHLLGDPAGKIHHALVRVVQLEGGFRLLVGRDLEEGENLRQILSNALFTSLFWLVVIGTLGGLWIARRVLNRVDAINANARAIVAGDLSGRLRLAGTGDELDRLVENFNAMLERMSVLLAGLKEVSDNIAHDLKTPLTRLRSGLEQALRTAKSPEDYQQALTKALEESDGLIQIFNALLSIARAEAGAGREGMVDFDAAGVLRDVSELYEPVAEERGIALTLKLGVGLALHGSRELISQALANLVDNALKYGAPDKDNPNIKQQNTVELSARRTAGQVEFIIADHGAGIPEADHHRVLERFVRLENARSRPGSGLGLSLAAAVARLHNGCLHLEDNGPGLRVIIRLPAAPLNVIEERPIAVPGKAA